MSGQNMIYFTMHSPTQLAFDDEGLSCARAQE
jgi:hypothetical protein